MLWFDPILLGFAALIEYSDWVLDWLSEATGKTFNILHLIAFEIVAALGLCLFMASTMQSDPRLQWWKPLLFVGLMAVFRLTHRFLTSLFD